MLYDVNNAYAIPAEACEPTDACRLQFY